MSEPLKRPVFPSVKNARELLKSKAAEILEEFQQMIRLAAASGEYESALKAQQWLVDHIPAEDGVRLFDGSADKQVAVDSGPRGPMIQIGIAVGGVKKRDALLIEGEKVEE